LGIIAAAIPNRQINVKIEPTTGFRQGNSSKLVVIFKANISVVNKPKAEINT